MIFFPSAKIVYLTEVPLSFVVSFLSSVHQAIFELSQGEQDLIEDLKLAKKVHSAFHINSYCMKTFESWFYPGS